MKRWLWLIFILLILVIASIYLMFPNDVEIHQVTTIPVNAKAFSRTITDTKKWKEWWPGSSLPGSSIRPKFSFNDYTYTILEHKFSSLVIDVNNAKDSFRTELFFIPLTPDTVSIAWNGGLASDILPLNRFRLYYKSQHLNSDMEVILQRLQQFYGKEENLYGMAIKNDLVTDSLLISTVASIKGYPSVDTIYSLIASLKNYAQQNGAKPTGFPMLNINTTDSIHYTVKVALPVNKKLNGKGAIEYKWMLGGGRILMTEVKGGPHNIQTAMKEITNYIDDYKRTAPAIPFQSLVTDRSKEKDTSKWVTRVYWPVM